MAKKIEYVEFPSKRKLTVMLGIIVALYLFALMSGRLIFPHLDDATRLMLSRAGTFFLFLAGLLASVGFYWNSKVQYNIALATAVIVEAEGSIHSLNRVKVDLGDKLSKQIQYNEQRLEIARDRLFEAKQFPGWIDYAGRISLGFLTVGTLLILFGLG